jgi:hypothetical protein
VQLIDAAATCLLNHHVSPGEALLSVSAYLQQKVESLRIFNALG